MEVNNASLYRPQFHGITNDKQQAETRATKEETTATNNADFAKISDPSLESIGRDLVPQKPSGEEVLLSRIKKYIKVVPDNGYLNKPIMVNIPYKIMDKEYDHKFGFTVDKTDPEKIKVLIKENVESPETWNEKHQGETLLCILDKNGRMTDAQYINGAYYKCERIGMFFTRDKRNKRTIMYNGEKYQPVGNSQNEWKIVKNALNPGSYINGASWINGIGEEFNRNNDSTLMNIFKKLTNKDATIFD